MSFSRALLILIALALPLRLTWGQRADLTETAREESIIDIDIDEGVTDPRGDESPNPRAADLVCDNVVCGDEVPPCSTCGKPGE